MEQRYSQKYANVHFRPRSCPTPIKLMCPPSPKPTQKNLNKPSPVLGSSFISGRGPQSRSCREELPLWFRSEGGKWKHRRKWGTGCTQLYSTYHPEAEGVHTGVASVFHYSHRLLNPRPWTQKLDGEHPKQLSSRGHWSPINRHRCTVTPLEIF